MVPVPLPEPVERVAAEVRIVVTVQVRLADAADSLPVRLPVDGARLERLDLVRLLQREITHDASHPARRDRHVVLLMHGLVLRDDLGQVRWGVDGVTRHVTAPERRERLIRHLEAHIRVLTVQRMVLMVAARVGRHLRACLLCAKLPPASGVHRRPLRLGQLLLQRRGGL